jgi:hypothetical protein
VQLDEHTRITPDVVAQVNNGIHKQCKTVDHKYLAGPPNFIFDIFRDNQTEEYEFRRQRFEKSGVLEYVAWQTTSDIPVWNRLIEGSFHETTADDDGLIKSTALPGMWISVEALKNRDWWSVMATISRGITRRGHRDFMATIWKD